MRIAALLALLIATLLIDPATARAETRIALVIGNSAYQSASALPNPTNDADDVTASLKRLDFNVSTLTNARYDDMRRALIAFGQQARGVDIAVIFFAGHGMEIGGDNWLIPVDAQLATDLDVASEAIGLQTLMRAVSNSNQLGLVILDACRNNPFLPKMQRTSLTRAVDRGFTRVEPNDNVLVAYAARDGTTATDGTGRNSPFTASLLKNIETPGLEIGLLFRIVRDDVMTATKRQQQPFIYGSLSKDLVYLKTGSGSASNQPAEQRPPPEPVVANLQPSKSARDEFDFAFGFIQTKNYERADGVLQSLLQKYPKDDLIPEATYWLGETRFQRQRYREAAETFLTAVTKFESSARAPEAMLRLGQSLAALKEKEAACAAFSEVRRKFPQATMSVKSQADRELKQGRC